jgi:hypothetical protein
MIIRTVNYKEVTMARTYLPTLVDIVYRLCTYITRWKPIILEFMPPSVKPAFLALEAACSVFLEEMAGEGYTP